MIYSRESKNDKNFIWYDTTAVIVLIGLCFCLSSVIILCINYHVWLQHLWPVSSLICHNQNLYSNTFTHVSWKIEPESNTKVYFLKSFWDWQKEWKTMLLLSITSWPIMIYTKFYSQENSQHPQKKLTIPCQLDRPMPNLVRQSSPCLLTSKWRGEKKKKI